MVHGSPGVVTRQGRQACRMARSHVCDRPASAGPSMQLQAGGAGVNGSSGMGWRIQSVRRRFGAGAMLLALAAAMPAAAGARGPETGWYVGLAAIGAIADLDGISTDGFTGTEVLEYGKDE